LICIRCAGEKPQAGGRLKLQVSLGNAMIFARGHGAPETAAAFDRARELATSVEDVSERKMRCSALVR
jgi:hypothetical protein